MEMSMDRIRICMCVLAVLTAAVCLGTGPRNAAARGGWTLEADRHVLCFAAEAVSGSEVVLFLDPYGRGTTVYRLAFSRDGGVRDAVAADDNTNRDKFTVDEKWCSHAVSRVRRDGDAWSVSAEIPLGSFRHAGASAPEWGVRVSCDERVSSPKDYERRALPSISRSAYDVEIMDPDVKVRRDGGELRVYASVPVRSVSGSNVACRVKAEVEAAGALCAGEPVGANAAKRPDAVEVSAPCGSAKAGSTVLLRLGVWTDGGVLLDEIYREVALDYSPVSIRMTAPCYRDCVFDSMKLERIAGEVLLEDGIGRPITVELSGPDTKESVRIASAKATNEFSFAFAGRRKGTYFVRAGGCERRIRNLPFLPGEIWIGPDRVVRCEGRRMFPYGWYSETFGSGPVDGVNIAQTYNIYLKKPCGLDALTAEANSNRCGLVISPMQDFMPVPRERLFGKVAAQGTFDADGLGEMRRRALVEFAERARTQRGFFAYYLQDEPEGRDLSPGFFREAKRILEDVDPYHPTIIVNYTVSGIRRFAESCDILCPDTYPVYTVGGPVVGKLSNTYEWCRAASRHGVTSMFSPQAFDWDYKVGRGRVTRGPTYLELRAQSLIALAGDVRGLMLYSRYSMNTPSEHLRLGPKFLIGEILESKDVFLSDSEYVEVEAAPGKSPVIAALKRCGGESLLIAVNTAYNEVTATFASESLPGALYLGGSSQVVNVVGGRFSDRFGPYEAKVYHSVPKAFDPGSAAAEIAAAEARRVKPGNLALARRFLTWSEMKRMRKGELDNGFPKVTATSMSEANPFGLPRTYFLQDGFADEVPYLPYHGWSPDYGDASPAVTVDFGERRRVGRVVLTCCADVDGRYKVSSGSVEIGGCSVAGFERTGGGRVVVDFAPVEADSVTIRLKGKSVKSRGAAAMRAAPWLSEVEVYGPADVPSAEGSQHHGIM